MSRRAAPVPATALYEAKAIGCGIRDVYNGRRRLKTHVDAVRKLMEGW